MNKFLQFTSLVGLMIFALSACVPALGAVNTQTTKTASSPQQVQTQTTAREAQVQSVEIQIIQAGPVLVNAIIHGNLNEYDGVD